MDTMAQCHAEHDQDFMLSIINLKVHAVKYYLTRIRMEVVNLVGKLDGKRPIGRHRSTLENNIKVDLK
jgi:phage baseplate assembly protein W